MEKPLAAHAWPGGFVNAAFGAVHMAPGSLSSAGTGSPFALMPAGFGAPPGSAAPLSAAPLYSPHSLFPGQPLPAAPPPPCSSSAFGPPPLTITAPTPPPSQPVCAPFPTPPGEAAAEPGPGSAARPAPVDSLPAPEGTRVYKLPLQLTKSIEEMLKPVGTAAAQDEANWNKPLTMDWADLKVSTPAFNREVVAKFFPECVPNNSLG